PAPLDYLAVLNHSSHWLPWVWIVGAPLTFLLLASGLIGVERLRRNSQPLTAGPTHRALQRLQKSLRVGRQVTIAVSERVVQPVLVGIVRPLILLPPAAVSGWSPEQLEMALVHELAHVRRWDNLVNFVQRLVESLLFFHPAVWLVSRWLRIDREHCCDAIVVHHTAAPEAYADLLLNVAATAKRQALPLASSALARHPLARRIRRILQLEDDPMLISRSTLSLVGLALIAIVCMLLWQPVSDTVAQDSTNDGVELNEESTSNAEKPQLHSFEMWVQLADDPRVFSDPGAGKVWQDTQIELIKSPLVLERAIQLLAEQEDVDVNTQLPASEEWLLKHLEIRYGNDGMHFTLSSKDKSKAELQQIVRAIAKSYSSARMKSDRALPKKFTFPPNTPHEKIEQLSQEYQRQGRSVTIRSLEGDGIVLVVSPMAPPTPAEVGNSPFLPLAQQRIADLAYRMFSVEFAPLHEETLPAVEEQGFSGGVLVEYGAAKEESRHYSGLKTGDILVGLHVWPTADFDALAEVLRRDDLMEFSPLKYYVLRPVPAANEMEGDFGEFGGERSGRGGEFGRGGGEFGRGGGEFGRGSGRGGGRTREEAPKAKLQLITGRITIPPEAWQAEQQRLERAKIKTSVNPNAIGLQRQLVELRHQRLLKDRENATQLDSQIEQKHQLGELFRNQEDRQNKHPSNATLNTSNLANLLYDGRTFDQWRTQWKTELKIENRTEAIKALAAFGRTGYGKEAAETIFDVAAEYDFAWARDTEKELFRAITEALVHSIPPRIWFPLLRDLYDSDPQKWDEIVMNTIPEIRDNKVRSEQIDWLLEIDPGESYPTVDPTRALVYLDPQLEDDKIRQHLQQLLHSSKQSEQMAGINALLIAQNRQGLLSELVNLTFNSPESFKADIRQALGRHQRVPVGQEVATAMLQVLESPETSEEQALDVIRNLAALGRAAKAAREPLLQVVHGDSPKLQVAAAVALAHIGGSTQPVLLLQPYLASDEGELLNTSQIQAHVSTETESLFNNVEDFGGGGRF
ncbi:MAG: M56 family metallopeptidase, partial [Aeoliella sp.]